MRRKQPAQLFSLLLAACMLLSLLGPGLAFAEENGTARTPRQEEAAQPVPGGDGAEPETDVPERPDVPGEAGGAGTAEGESGREDPAEPDEAEPDKDDAEDAEDDGDDEPEPEEEPPLNAEPICGSAWADGVTVTVEAPVGSFPEGTVLRIAALSRPDAQSLAESLVPASEAVAFDVNFTGPDGDRLQPEPDAPVRVSFTVDGGSELAAPEEESAQLRLYHLGGGAVELMETAPAPPPGGAVSVSVDAAHFSVYMLLKTGAQRAPARTAHDNVITSIEAQLADGSGPVGSVGQWQVFRLRAAFALPNNQVHEGDTTTITLPDKLKFDQVSAFEIKDDDGKLVANAVIDGPSKTLTITYTAYPEQHSDVTGKFYFYVRIDRSQVDAEEDIELIFQVGNQTVVGGTIHFAGIPTPTVHYLGKSGKQSDNRTIHYQIDVNRAKGTISNAVLTDVLESPGFAIVPSSLIIYKGTWRAVHGDWSLDNASNVTGSYPVTFGEDGRSFAVSLGNLSPDVGFRLYYDAVANYDLVDGEVILNSATLSGNDTVIASSNAYATYHEAGGSAEGYVYTIKIHKVDPDDNTLAGAVFEVIRVSTGASVGTVTTDAAGDAALGGLLKDSYEILELAAPPGFEPLTEPIRITPEDFGSDKIASYTVINAPSTFSIPVSKIWTGGPAAESVTIRLYADGVELAHRVLNERNNWKASFDGLSRIDPVDGHVIVYALEEDDVPGYSGSQSGSPDSGVVFTNRNIQTIDIPVQKYWVGPEREEVRIRLLRNDTDISRILILTKENGWKGSFTGLPKFDENGAAYRYRITEEELENNTVEIAGDAEQGYEVTNMARFPITIPVQKRWVGPAGASVTVRLYGDGVPLESLVLNELNNWQGRFGLERELFRYDLTDGHEIIYSVDEDELEDYTKQLLGDAQTGFTVINTVSGKISIPVQKRWIGPAQQRVTVKLMDGDSVAGTVELSADNGWQHVFEGLERYRDGVEIPYRVVEEPVPNYEASVTGDAQTGFVVTNRNVEKVSVPVLKQWRGTPLTRVSVYLWADGALADFCVLTADNDWRHTFTNLDRYNGDREIVYTVTEQRVSGCTVSITGDQATGFVITNTRITDPGRAPRTGDRANLPLYAALLLLSGAGLAGTLFFRRRKKPGGK